MTDKDRTIDGLLRSGCVEAIGVTKKYRVFRFSADHVDRGGLLSNDVTYLVGRSGALRVTLGAIADSQSLTGSPLHKHLISGGTLHPFFTGEPEPCKP